jgi:hypothetical protein
VCAHIAALPLLSDVSVADNLYTLSERGLRAIARMPHLTALDVSKCHMTDALFEEFAQHCRSLTALKMVQLDVALVTPAAIAHLSRLPRLRWSLVDAAECNAAVESAVKTKQGWDLSA